MARDPPPSAARRRHYERPAQQLSIKTHMMLIVASRKREQRTHDC
jgi:hypothetical protein